MKNSAIIDIFKGNRGHNESMHMHGTDEYNEYLDIASQAREELEKKLSPELLEVLDKYIDARDDIFSEELEFFFKEGFKLGLDIGIECMDD